MLLGSLCDALSFGKLTSRVLQGASRHKHVHTNALYQEADQEAIAARATVHHKKSPPGFFPNRQAAAMPLGLGHQMVSFYSHYESTVIPRPLSNICYLFSSSPRLDSQCGFTMAHRKTRLVIGRLFLPPVRLTLPLGLGNQMVRFYSHYASTVIPRPLSNICYLFSSSRASTANVVSRWHIG
jgi:hypothetical protein